MMAVAGVMVGILIGALPGVGPPSGVAMLLPLAACGGGDGEGRGGGDPAPAQAADPQAQRLRELAESDIYWDTVVSIEPSGLQDTYDLTVEEDHNFVANGLVVHNSHSTAYALIAYMTAYLKAHWPVEFMAALLSGDMSNRNFKRKDSLVEHLEDCRRLLTLGARPCIAGRPWPPR